MPLTNLFDAPNDTASESIKNNLDASKIAEMAIEKGKQMTSGPVQQVLNDIDAAKKKYDDLVTGKSASDAALADTQNKLKKLEEGHVEFLTGGNIKTMEDYKFVMGELSMLRTLREELKEALHIEGDPLDE